MLNNQTREEILTRKEEQLLLKAFGYRQKKIETRQLTMDLRTRAIYFPQIGHKYTAKLLQASLPQIIR
jgi:hypothetical protein